MTTPRLLAANRANARKSTGPRTAAGKARSARNHTTYGFYTRGLVPLPGPLLDDALRRAAAASAEFPHDPQLAQLASAYILLAARHTYIVYNIDAFTRWMFSAADPLAWVRLHGAFLRGALHALSHLRGLLRAAEREILPALDDYHCRFGSPRPLTRAAAAGRIEPVSGGAGPQACRPTPRSASRRATHGLSSHLQSQLSLSNPNKTESLKTNIESSPPPPASNPQRPTSLRLLLLGPSPPMPLPIVVPRIHPHNVLPRCLHPRPVPCILKSTLPPGGRPFWSAPRPLAFQRKENAIADPQKS